MHASTNYNGRVSNDAAQTMVPRRFLGHVSAAENSPKTPTRRRLSAPRVFDVKKLSTERRPERRHSEAVEPPDELKARPCSPPPLPMPREEKLAAVRRGARRAVNFSNALAFSGLRCCDESAGGSSLPRGVLVQTQRP